MNAGVAVGLVSMHITTVKVGVGVDVSEGVHKGVSVGVLDGKKKDVLVGVSVGGFGGRLGVFVGGIGVFVGGTGVLVGGTGVLVGGTGVLVGGFGIGVGVHANTGVASKRAATRTAMKAKNFIFISFSLFVNRVKTSCPDCLEGYIYCSEGKSQRNWHHPILQGRGLYASRDGHRATFLF